MNIKKALNISLIVKQIKILLLSIFLCFTFLSKAQSNQCSFENLLETVIVEDIKYVKDNSIINLENALKYDHNEFIGFIGKNKKRLRVFFTPDFRTGTPKLKVKDFR